jgi:hypothetical protein
VVFLVVAVVGGLLLTGPREVLRRPAFWGAGTLAVLLALPNLVWQARHGWPQLAMGQALSASNAAEVRLLAVPTLLVLISAVLLPVCLAGGVALFRRPELGPVRWLVPALAVVVGLTMLAGAQVHYPYGLLVAVFAVGCVPAAELARPTRPRLVLLAAGLGIHVLVGVLISLPVLPEPALAATGVTRLNTNLAEQTGWVGYVDQIDRVTADARARDPGVVVLASNYGEAGALGRYSSHRDVPVVSGHNALGLLPGPPPDTRTVVVVGFRLPRVAASFSSCTAVDRLDNRTGIEHEEQGQPIAVCTGPRQDWATLWPALRHFS